MLAALTVPKGAIGKIAETNVVVNGTVVPNVLIDTAPLLLLLIKSWLNL